MTDEMMIFGICLKKLGGRLEISRDDVLSLEGVAVVQWDDPATGNRVWMLQTLTASDASAEHDK